MKYIDTHAHVFSHQTNFLATARYTPSYTVNVEDYINCLDTNGFDKGVLIQPSFYGNDNSYMLEAIQRYPDRLKGIAVLDCSTDMATLLKLEKQGIVGTRLNLFGLPCPNLTDLKWQDFLSNIATLNWQVEIHAPVSYLLQLLPALNEYKINVVIDHFGRFSPNLGVKDPEYQRFLEIINPIQHWIKVSGYYRVDNNLSIQNATEAFKLLKQYGMESRLIWGSDWPHTQFEDKISFDKSLNDFKFIVNNDELLNQILTKNNASLFGF